MYSRGVSSSFSEMATDGEFLYKKSASCGDVPMIPLDLPPPKVPDPPKAMKKQVRALKKKHKYRDTIRKSAQKGMDSIRRRYRNDKVFYIIYNISQKEALKFNEERGLRLSEINWKLIRQVMHWWRHRDYIWAVSTDGKEYDCILERNFARNPEFGLKKKKMPKYILERYHTGKYEYYYYSKLIEEQKSFPERDCWILIKEPFTGKVIDVC